MTTELVYLQQLIFKRIFNITVFCTCSLESGVKVNYIKKYCFYRQSPFWTLSASSTSHEIFIFAIQNISKIIWINDHDFTNINTIHWPGLVAGNAFSIQLDIIRVMITQLPACDVHRNMVSTVNSKNIYVYLVTFFKYCYLTDINKKNWRTLFSVLYCIALHSLQLLDTWLRQVQVQRSY